jgi:hypothetical protein
MPFRNPKRPDGYEFTLPNTSHWSTNTTDQQKIFALLKCGKSYANSPTYPLASVEP